MTQCIMKYLVSEAALIQVSGMGNEMDMAMVDPIYRYRAISGAYIYR